MNNLQRTQILNKAINFCINNLGKNIGSTPLGCLLIEQIYTNNLTNFTNYKWWKELLDTDLVWTHSFECGYAGYSKNDCKFPIKPIDPTAYKDKTINDDAYDLGKSFRQQYWNILC